MRLSSHAENKYAHKQTKNTHKNTQIFGQLRPRQNPFNLLRGKPVRELFKFIYLSSSRKIHLQTKQNNKIQLISSAQNSLKTVPSLPRFSCPLEAENMYYMNTIVQTIPYGLYELYGFLNHCIDFFQKKIKNFSRMAYNSQRSVLFVL